MTMFNIYLIMQANAISAMFIVVGAVLGICQFIWTTSNEQLPKYRWLCLFISLILFGNLIPSTKTLIAMYGIPAVIKGVEAVASNEEVKRVPTLALKAMNNMFKDYLDEGEKK